MSEKSQKELPQEADEAGTRLILMMDQAFEAWVQTWAMTQGVEFEVEYRHPITAEVTYWEPVVVIKEPAR